MRAIEPCPVGVPELQTLVRELGLSFWVENPEATIAFGGLVSGKMWSGVTIIVWGQPHTHAPTLDPPHVIERATWAG